LATTSRHSRAFIRGAPSRGRKTLSENGPWPFHPKKLLNGKVEVKHWRYSVSLFFGAERMLRQKTEIGGNKLYVLQYGLASIEFEIMDYFPNLYELFLGKKGIYDRHQSLRLNLLIKDIDKNDYETHHLDLRPILSITGGIYGKIVLTPSVREDGINVLEIELPGAKIDPVVGAEDICEILNATLNYEFYRLKVGFAKVNGRDELDGVFFTLEEDY
jgi:hypothetical protein